MPKLTLYRKDGACSIAAHMLLRELRLPFTDIPMKEDRNRKYEPAEHTNVSREDFLKVNPAGYVPVLVVDGTVITELSAVLFYISSLKPQREFTGRTPIEQAMVLEWMSWLGTTLNEYGFLGYWRPSRMMGANAPKKAEQALRDEGMKTILKGVSRLEQKMQGEFAIGEYMAVVDLMLHTFWRWSAAAGLDMGRYPAFTSVARRVESLASVRQTLQIEHVELQFPAN